MSKMNTVYRLIGLQHGERKKKSSAPQPPLSINVSITTNARLHKLASHFQMTCIWPSFAKDTHGVQTPE